MNIDVRPLRDRLLVKRDAEETKTAGGLHIPEHAKEKPREGEVISVGKGRYEDGSLVAVDVKAGDKILFGRYSGTEVKIDDVDYLILREDEVLAVIGKKKAH